MPLHETMRSVGLPLDERGLVELEEARRRVAAERTFARGEGRLVHGSWIWDSERLWTSLLSLENAEEFVREASRLEWRFHPRASQYLEPAERFGREILPWLFSFVRGNVLVNVPACVVPLLCDQGGGDSFEPLLGLDGVSEDSRRVPGPFAPDGPGNVDVASLVPSVEAAERALLEFAWTHPKPSFSLLYEKAAVEGDERARNVLRRACVEQPSRVRAWIVEDWEEDEARADLERMGVSFELTSDAILAQLDRSCAHGESWPVFSARHPDRACHALRLVVFREREGDGWTIVFESLEGSSAKSLCVRRYAHSATLFAWLDATGRAELFVDVARSDATSLVLVGPAGEMRVAPASDARDPSFTLLVRAYLDENPDAFWSDEAVLRDALELEGFSVEGYELFLTSTVFEHVVGTQPSDGAASDLDTRRRIQPSESAVYRSLARALVERDSSLFEPGVSH